MIPYRLIAYGVAVLAVIGVLYGIYHSIDSKAYERGKAEVTAQWEEANRKQREADAQQSAAASAKLEEGNQASRVVYRTITKTVDKLVLAPMYANACFDDAGIAAANQALLGVSDTATQRNPPNEATDAQISRPNGTGLRLPNR